jgi:predicted nucleic acid-binding Zn ribbon protein
MDKTQRTRSTFTPLGQVLAEVIERCRSENNGGLMHLVQVWDKAVGAPIADNARPFAVNGPLLLVHVTSSVWLHQLRFLKAELLEALNRELKHSPLSDIKFKVGPLS